MKIATISKYLTFSIAISLSAACSYVNDSKDVIVIQNQSASSIISNLRHLNIEKNISANDENLQLFLKGYEYLQIGNIVSSK